MSNKTFQQYGKLAKSEFSHTVASGRYRVHVESEPHMIRDIISKLELKSTDRLLEIGCGAGNLLIPLSFMVAEATGIDHPNVIERLGRRFTDPGLRLIGTDFLDYQPAPDELYDRVLINSVLEALTDEAEAIEFIEKAAGLLAPRGRLLIGDIANVDKKKRFIETKFGQDFSQEWQDRLAAADGGVHENEAAKILLVDDEVFLQTDDFVLDVVRRFRRPGWEAYCLPQPPDLPLGYTREDVLIMRLAD